MDINKKEQHKIPESVGIALLIPLWVSAIAVYLLTLDYTVIAWVVMVSLFSLIGRLDDKKHKFSAKTLNWSTRATIIAVVSLAFSALFFQSIPEIILAALFLAGLASFQNTFAGLNGWEIGSGFILSVFVGLLISAFPFFPLAVTLAGAITALLLFNVFPAKIFPGDSGTLLIGSALAGLIIMTQSIALMSVAFFFYIPHIIDFSAKMISNPRDPSQIRTKPYRLLENGKLDFPKSCKKYDFAKIIIRLLGPLEEKRIVLVIWAVLIFNCSLVLIFLA